MDFFAARTSKCKRHLTGSWLVIVLSYDKYVWRFSHTYLCMPCSLSVCEDADSLDIDNNCLFQDLLSDDTFNCDDDENPQSASSPLEVFLESHGLGELHSLFLKESMDLEALVLCSEADLAILNVPLGPRKKLLEACSRRTHTLRRFRAMLDTHL